MIATQPLEVSDFSFGITDYFIDGLPTEAEEMDNLVINRNKKLETRWGSIVINDQFPQGATRVSYVTHLNDLILSVQGRRVYWDNSGTWTEIVGPSSLQFFPSLGSANSVILSSEWRNHLFFTNSEFSSPQKFFIDDVGNKVVVNAGLPEVPSGISITPPAGAGSSYLYAFCLKYEYMVGSVTFLDRGPVFYYPSAVTGGAITGGTPASLTLPLSLPTPENWDTSNIEIEIYRTVDAGDTYYLAGTVPLGTSPFSDNTADASLQLNETLYTTGGVLSNGTPPAAKLVHVVNEYGYYAVVKDGTEVDEFIVLQSKVADPDSVPATNYVRTEQPIRGLSSIFDRPVVLCSRYIYRIDNFFDDIGGGGMFLRRIDDKAGCVSAQSVVQTHAGLFWAGTEGFYWSDGFRVVPISDHLNISYKSLTLNTDRKKNIQGRYDSSNQRVYWTVCVDSGDNEPDQIWVLDLKFPFLGEGGKKGGTFTSWSGGDSFKPSAIDYVATTLYRADSRGFLFAHKDTYFTDPKVDVLEATVDWNLETIIHQYKSCFLDFGSKMYRKFIPRILISAANTTNLSLAIHSSNDNNRVQGDLKPIRYTANITWGESLPYWSDPQARWNYQGLIEEWRRFPAGGLRCNYKQVQFTNALVQIINSDVLGAVTVNVTAKTATLSTPKQWLSNIVDYFLFFESDGYSNAFKIVSSTPTTVVYEDPNNNGPPIDGSYKFILKGYPKGEFLSLNGYVIHWALLSKSHTPFSASSLGGSPA